MSAEKISIEIDRADLVLLEVAIEERMKTWRRTREYWLKYEENESFENINVEGDIEEANSLYEAEKMVAIWEGFRDEFLMQIAR